MATMIKINSREELPKSLFTVYIPPGDESLAAACDLFQAWYGREPEIYELEGMHFIALPMNEGNGE